MRSGRLHAAHARRHRRAAQLVEMVPVAGLGAGDEPKVLCERRAQAV
jgi:hypothetical protein